MPKTKWDFAEDQTININFKMIAGNFEYVHEVDYVHVGQSCYKCRDERVTVLWLVLLYRFLTAI